MTASPPVPEIDSEALAAALAQGATLIDVRTREEHEQAHVAGARLIPLDELEARSGEVPKDGPVYVICALGGRSMAAATALKAAGWDAVNVKGGTNGWVEEGRPYETGSA